MNDALTIIKSYLVSRYCVVILELKQAIVCGTFRQEFFAEQFGEDVPFSYYLLDEISDVDGRMKGRWEQLFLRRRHPTPFPLD